MALPRWFLLVAAAACGGLGQGLAAWGSSTTSFVAALGVFALGGWLLARLDGGAAARLSIDTAPEPMTPRLPRGWRLALLAIVLGLSAAAMVHVDATFSLLQICCYGASLVALVAFARAMDRSASLSQRGDSAPDRGEVAIVLALTAVALFFRLWQLARIPGLIWDDEILYLSDALQLSAEGLLSPFASGEWGAPYLHAYSIAGAAAFVSDRTVALRLVSAIPGALTVPLLYLAMRELFDRRFAFFAALLLAVAVWHTILSRQGYVWAINGFAESLALYGLARGLKRGRFVDFLVSGVGLGLGVVYTYAALVMPVVLVVFAVYASLLAPGLVRARLAGMLFLVLCAFVVAGPRLTALGLNSDMRGYQVGATVLSEEEGSPLELFSLQLGQIAQAFNRSADNNELYVPGPREPLLDPVTAAVFGLGFFWAVFSLRQLGAALLLLTFVLMLLPPALGLSSTDWATAWRACGVVPGLFGLAAAPFALAVGVARSRWGRCLTFTAIGSLLALVVLVNAHSYFVRHAAKPRWSYGHNATHTEAARRVLEAPAGVRILVSQDVSNAHVRLLAGGVRAFEVFNWPDEDWLPQPPSDQPVPTLVLAAAQLYWEDDVGSGAVLVDLLQHYYPSGRGEIIVGADGRPLLASFAMSAADIEAAQGLGDDALDPLRHTGTLVVPADGNYRLQADGDGASGALEIDASPFRAGFLARGLHDVALTGAGRDAPVLQWSREGEALAPVPPSLLLRRPLPHWGFRESVRRGGQTLWQRWVPLLWFVADLDFDLDTDAEVEWSGEVCLSQPGSYTMLATANAETSIWLDGEEIVAHDRPWPDWLRLPLDLAAGRHSLRIVCDAPVEKRDLRLFWIDDSNHPRLFGSEVACD